MFLVSITLSPQTCCSSWKKIFTHDEMLSDNFSDIFSDSESDSEDSVFRRNPNKIVRPFSEYGESDSSDDYNDMYYFAL